MDERHPEIQPLPALEPLRAERRDAAAHRQRILDVARTLFAERGVDAVSMHQIAQTACVGQGTLYRRYAHKGELCLDVMRDSGERFLTEIETYLAESAGDVPPLERLDTVLARVVSFVEEKASFLNAIHDAAPGHRRAMQYHTPYYCRLHDAVAALLAEAVDRNDLPAMDVTLAADALLSALAPDLYLFQRRERGFTPEQILDGVRCLYIRGLDPKRSQSAQ